VRLNALLLRDPARFQTIGSLTHCAGIDSTTFAPSYTLTDARNNVFAFTVVNLQCPEPSYGAQNVVRAAMTAFPESTTTAPISS
jgi:hypothetical protein